MTITVDSSMGVEQAIRKFIADDLLFTEADLPIGDDDFFLENSVIDSLGILELQLFVERTFGIRVRDDEVVPENFDSVRRLGRYVRGKTHANGGPEHPAPVSS